MIRTFVIDPNKSSRLSTTSALQYEQLVSIVGESEQFMANVGNADVVVFRAETPDCGSLATVQQIATQFPNVKVLVNGLQHSEASALAFIEMGARGYVFEDDSHTELVRNIKAAHENRARISTQMAASLMQRLYELRCRSKRDDERGKRYKLLTPREKQILALIDEGLSNRKIAERLYVEAGTVKNHVHNILKKLGVQNRRDAATFNAPRLRLQPTFGD